MNCNMCHGKTAGNVTSTSHTALKDYTGALRHANGTKNVIFTNIAYGSYTSYKAAGSGSAGTSKTCENVACHGGKTRNPWTEQGQVNTTNTCTHCHGQTQAANISPSNTNLKMYAPGWNNGGIIGTSSDQNTANTDPRVGAHFGHLSSTIAGKVKCNECHRVPSNPFDPQHTDSPRFSSQTLTFAQASTANKRSVVTAFIAGTASTPVTCTTTYCHRGNWGSGTAMSPAWNNTTYLSSPPTVTECRSCHGLPPRKTFGHASTAVVTNVATLMSLCSGCHKDTLKSTGGTDFVNVFLDKSKHMNGNGDAAGGSSHVYGYGGNKHSAAAGSPPFSSCGCHTVSPGGSYPVLRGTAPICTACHTNSANFTATPGCGDCHGTNYNTTGRPDGNTFPNNSGSHTAHVAVMAYACSDCHNGAGSGTPRHGNYSGIKKTTYANVSVAFNTAKSGATARWNKGASLSASSCTTSNCHGQKSPAWGAPVPPRECQYCHGSQTLAYTGYTQATIAPGLNNIDTNRVSGIVTPRGGMHQEHLLATDNQSRRVRCSECHASVTPATLAAHLNMTTATVVFSGVAVTNTNNPAPSATRVSGLKNCSNVECHTGKRKDGTAAGESGFASRPALVWNSSLIGNTSIADTCTDKCHGMPPNRTASTDTHYNIPAVTIPQDLGTNCSSQLPATKCHPGLNASPTNMTNIWFDKNLHINGIVEASGGTCLGCHAGPKGNRYAIGSKFSQQSHHVQGRAVTDADCYQCHLEALDTTGKEDTQYHKQGIGSNAAVNLVIWTNAGARPTGTQTMGTTYISYTANGSRNSIGKLNQHCLGCHNSSNANLAPFTGTPNDTNTTSQYSPEPRLAAPKAKTSILSRYSSTRTVQWSLADYSTATGGAARFGTNNKSQITKALSAHGNATKNQFPQWDAATGGKGEDGYLSTDSASATLSSKRNVFCYDCHNSHGSDAAGITSSYSSATGRYKGGLLKSTVNGEGGYTVTYKPAARTILYKNYSTTATTTATVNAGASICNDCHNTDTRIVSISRPWSITGTFSSSKAIVGYWSTPYFENYTFASAKRTTYKQGGAVGTNKDLRKPMGGHFGTSVSGAQGTSTTRHTAGSQYEINGLCTPCHDPHGVSNALGASGVGAAKAGKDYGVPLLKGTWVTSPYREDKADILVKRGGGSNFSGIPNGGAVPGYHIDQNTFLPVSLVKNGGAAVATTTANQRSQRFRSFSLLSSAQTMNGNQPVATTAGLCINCHTQALLTGNAAPTTSAPWTSVERVHQSVNGWGSTNGTNTSNKVHAYSCAKCHSPHVSRLPRLLVTNCLDVRHFGRKVSGGSIPATPVTTTTPGNILQTINTSSAYGAGRFPGGGSRYSNTPQTGQNSGGWWFQTNGSAGTTQPPASALPDANPNVPPAASKNYGSGCHNTSGAGGAAYDPTMQIWNKKSRW